MIAVGERLMRATAGRPGQPRLAVDNWGMIAKTKLKKFMKS
ncbi:hypothetical protein ILFOPFJJ_02974 [Ensifer psoraleae]|nr:hypothetical protein [Sinorhizobium psoraleae]